MTSAKLAYVPGISCGLQKPGDDLDGAAERDASAFAKVRPLFTNAANARPDNDYQVSGVKSSFSFANGNCVEVADLPGGHVGVRDSKDPRA